MSALDANSNRRAIADAIGVVHRRFELCDPPVVGAQFLSADSARGLEVRFLLSTESDVARASVDELSRRLKEAFVDALKHRGATVPMPDAIRVTVSSLEAQGIQRSNRY